MPPSGLAILLGAGPTTGAGIARMLASPEHGNLAVALLARREESLSDIASGLRSQLPSSVVETFVSDTSPDSLAVAFDAIRAHQSFAGLKLRLAIFSIKHSSKKPFLEESHTAFVQSLDTYVGGAFAFSQLCLKRFFADHGDADLASGAAKKGTLIFTGTLGALRCNAEFAAYGAGRAGVRQLAQSLAREMSPRGVHVVHAIANGSIRDEQGPDQERGKKMAAEAVGKTYLWLHGQGLELWTHELDLRPAQEKF